MNENISPQPIQEIPVTAKHFHLPRVLLVLFVALISAGLFGTIGYFLGMGHQISSSSNTPTIPALSSSNTTVAKPTMAVSPTTISDTSNWKAFSDPQYNFSFNYPENGIVTKKSQPGFVASLVSKQDSNLQPAGSIEIQSSRNIPENELSNYYDFTITVEKFIPPTAQYAPIVGLRSLLEKPTNYENSNISGITGSWISSDVGSDDVAILAFGNTKYYVLEMTGDNGEASSTSTKIFKQILSSFKFIQ